MTISTRDLLVHQGIAVNGDVDLDEPEMEEVVDEIALAVEMGLEAVRDSLREKFGNKYPYLVLKFTVTEI